MVNFGIFHEPNLKSADYTHEDKAIRHADTRQLYAVAETAVAAKLNQFYGCVSGYRCTRRKDRCPGVLLQLLNPHWQMGVNRSRGIHAIITFQAGKHEEYLDCSACYVGLLWSIYKQPNGGSSNRKAFSLKTYNTSKTCTN